MRNKILLIASLLLLPLLGHAQYDVVVVGGTPGGITTAISAAREGKRVVLLERTFHVGGLPANGLGATDITTRDATTGLFKEFVQRNKAYYETTYGAGSAQVKDCSDGYHFEPSVAEKTFLDMLEAEGDRITVLYGRQFDSDPANVCMEGGRIVSIQILNRSNGETETFSGKVFVDATYEGDLGAAANVPYHVGRESRAQYGEVCAGKIYRHWGVQFDRGEKSLYNGFEGYESEGTTYQGDNAVQAYNYRLCLTKEKADRRAIERPATYNRLEYASLVEDVWTGRNTGVDMMNVTPAQMEANREILRKGGVTQIPGDPWGMAKVTNMVKLPNGKTDANNQHMAFLSTDLPEENWPWPTASWEWRDAFAQRLKDYTLGLLWFVQNDKELPAQFRKACQEWGLSASEYADNDHFLFPARSMYGKDDALRGCTSLPPRMPWKSYQAPVRLFTGRALPPVTTRWIPMLCTSGKTEGCTWTVSLVMRVCPIPFRLGLCCPGRWITSSSLFRSRARMWVFPLCAWNRAGWPWDKLPALLPRRPSTKDAGYRRWMWKQFRTV